MSSIHFAPVQGHTDAAYRHFHSMIYGGNIKYYTPFIRLEKKELRLRDLKDINSELNSNHHLIPQIIFRDSYELNSLVELIKAQGYREIDLNMGCPFPLQTGHGRGAATISNNKLAREIVDMINNNQEIDFTVKLRLGMSEPGEWRTLMPFLNRAKLKHITLHPRVARQQYRGDINYNEFEIFLKESANPVIFNGDIKTPEDIELIKNRFLGIEGVMSARGILGRPSLFNEYLEGQTWDKEKRIEKLLEFHKHLFNHYSSVLCGDTQIISKIQPFWEFSEEEIGRKAWKTLKKATNFSKYQTAVAMIQG